MTNIDLKCIISKGLRIAEGDGNPISLNLDYNTLGFHNGEFQRKPSSSLMRSESRTADS